MDQICVTRVAWK